MVLVNMSLCVNIVFVCFIAQVAVDAVPALVRVDIYMVFIRPVFAELIYDRNQFLFIGIRRQCPIYHFVGRYLVKCKTLDVISHFREAEVLCPQLI